MRKIPNLIYYQIGQPGEQNDNLGTIIFKNQMNILRLAQMKINYI